MVRTGLEGRDRVAFVERGDLEVVPAVDPLVVGRAARALPQHRDRLVDPPEERLVLLEDLHSDPRAAALLLHQLLDRLK